MLEARDHGEDHHVAVACASILAKVRRDELFLTIAARYAGEFGRLGGWGYLNRPTEEFLRAYIGRYGILPPEARQSWSWEFAADVLGEKAVEVGLEDRGRMAGRQLRLMP